MVVIPPARHQLLISASKHVRSVAAVTFVMITKCPHCVVNNPTFIVQMMAGLSKTQEKAAARARARAARCNIQGCKVIDAGMPKLHCSCGEQSCNKIGHVDCYVQMILNGATNRCHFDESDTCAVTPTKIVCSVKCYRKAYNKYFVNINARNVPWSKDGPDGPDDPVNSESILIGWLLEPGNYSKF